MTYACILVPSTFPTIGIVIKQSTDETATLNAQAMILLSIPVNFNDYV